MAWPCYMSPCSAARAWWRHQMEKFSMLLAICAGNSPVRGESPYKGQWRGALMFCLICVWIKGWVNNGAVGDLRRYRAHGDVIVMVQRDNTHIHKYFSVRPYDECLKMHKTLCFGVVRKTLSSYFSFGIHLIISPTRGNYMHFPSANKPCDVIKWKRFPRYCPFLWGINWSPVVSPDKRTVTQTFDVSLLLVWTNCWTNTRLNGNPRRLGGHLT